MAQLEADAQHLGRRQALDLVEFDDQHLLQRNAGHHDVVAGGVMVRNSRATWMTRAQEWDYFHGIAAIKRVQSLYQGTMVAQGAFSLYDTKTLRESGGWPDCIGEDIVLSWGLLKAGYRIGYCERGEYSGKIIINGKEKLFRSIKDSEKASVAIIYQELALVRQLSIVENIFLGDEIAKNGVINWDESVKAAENAMAQVGLKPIHPSL